MKLKYHNTDSENKTIAADALDYRKIKNDVEVTELNITIQLLH